jgi:leader peptidase (prepilin peptidase)/N-methyltransferase
MDSVLASLSTTPAVLLALCALLGLAVGSFLNVVIHRLPKMLERQWQRECAQQTHGGAAAEEARYNLIVPRSACPACNHPISPLENIPIVSYLRLRGKCSSCGAAISMRYPLVEALCGAVTAYVVWRYGVTWTALAAMIFAWTMIALAFIDLDTFYLPDCITLPLVWAGLLAHIFGLFPGVELREGVIGAIAGYLALWSVFWLFKLATGKEGMGYGDFKLLGAIGAWLGWSALPLVILLSSMVGAVIGVVLMVARRQGRDMPIPFGPYLVVAGLIALFWGQALTDHYLELF